MGSARAGVERQVNQLAQLPLSSRCGAGTAAVPQAFAERQRRREQTARWYLVTQFDYLPVRVGYDTLFVQGELLITRQSYGPTRRPPGGLARPRAH